MRHLSSFPSAALVALLASAPLALPRAALAEDPVESPETVESDPSQGPVDLRSVIESGLSSEDIAVQSWAVRAAALAGEQDLLGVVHGQLEHANAAVRIAAATALVEAGHQVGAAEALLVTELLEGDANARTLILERLLPAMPEATRVAVLGGALDGIDEPSDAARQLIGHVARRTHGDEHAHLERATTVAEEIRTLVAEEVARARRPDGVAVARAFLSASDVSTRVQGAEIAIAINDVPAREALALVLNDSEAELAQRAGFHLARHGNTEALARVGELAQNEEMPTELRIQALQLLRDNGPQTLTFEALNALVEASAGDVDLRRAVFELLGASRSADAISMIEGQLNGLFADQRADGISGIGFSGRVEHIPTLASVLTAGGDQLLRLRAAEALGNLGGDESARVLVSQFSTERDDDVKVAIVHAMAKTGSSLVAQPIANEFSRNDAAIAMAGLAALREIGATDMAMQIESVSINFRNADVRWQAIVTLVTLDPELGRIRLLQALDRPPEGFREDLAHLSPALLAEVDERLLTHTDATIRENALFRVITRPDGGYAALRPLLDTQVSPDVRRQAIAVVTARRDPADAPLFLRLTEDTDRGLRLQGLAALAQLGDGQHRELFEGYLNHADHVLRMIATYALLNAGV